MLSWEIQNYKKYNDIYKLKFIDYIFLLLYVSALILVILPVKGYGISICNVWNDDF